MFHVIRFTVQFHFLGFPWLATGNLAVYVCICGGNRLTEYTRGTISCRQPEHVLGWWTGRSTCNGIFAVVWISTRLQIYMSGRDLTNKNKINSGRPLITPRGNRAIRLLASSTGIPSSSRVQGRSEPKLKGRERWNLNRQDEATRWSRTDGRGGSELLQALAVRRPLLLSPRKCPSSQEQLLFDVRSP